MASNQLWNNYDKKNVTLLNNKTIYNINNANLYIYKVCKIKKTTEIAVLNYVHTYLLASSVKS